MVDITRARRLSPNVIDRRNIPASEKLDVGKAFVSDPNKITPLGDALGASHLDRKLMGFDNGGEVYPHFKAGGGFDPERSAAYSLQRQGVIKSDVPGRTDKLNMNVPGGSYIIPADIVSALGQGNSEAGGSILNKMFNSGPYGMNLPRAKKGTRVGPRRSSLSFSRKQKFAEGGAANPQQIVAAGGEYVVTPDSVAELGNGDMDLGHSILDSFVKQTRDKHIKTLEGLKPPKGSK